MHPHSSFQDTESQKASPIHGKKRTRWSNATLADAFWQYCPGGDEDECWLWQGTLQHSGYGSFRYKYKLYVAHRVSYELHKGPITDGLYVCHDCDANYPAGDITYCRCVNPAHLWLGTHNDNMQDMMVKGRNKLTEGQDSPNAKLTELDIIAIRELARQGVTHEIIAQRFCVSRPLVSRIVRRERWKHVP